MEIPDCLFHVPFLTISVFVSELCSCFDFQKILVSVINVFSAAALAPRGLIVLESSSASVLTLCMCITRIFSPQGFGAELPPSEDLSSN